MLVPHAFAVDGLKVLVVDDDLDSCSWMGYALESYGIEVHLAFTVDQGLAAFAQFRPDVVLSDIALPGQDGYSCLRQIRQLENGQGNPTPIIAVTALSEVDAHFQGLEIKFDQWFTKPIDINELVEAIAQLTRQRLLVRELTSSY